LLDQLFEQLPIAWHSEHLGYTRAGAHELGVMLPPPRTQESFDLICPRIAQMQERYGAPFLLEHIVRVLPDCEGQYSEAGFMNALSGATGCGFVIDAYNLVCDRRNFGFDVEAFLNEIDFAQAQELHIAGGAEFEGFSMDSHSRRSDLETRRLAAEILERNRSVASIQAVTFEFLSQAIPALGHNAIIDELAALRSDLIHDELS
jgi:uncharacterized protein (UPF0276 family)